MLILRKDYFEPQFYFYYILISSFLASTWWSFSVTVSTGRNTYTNTNNPSKCWTQLLEIFLTESFRNPAIYYLQAMYFRKWKHKVEGRGLQKRLNT